MTPSKAVEAFNAAMDINDYDTALAWQTLSPCRSGLLVQDGLDSDAACREHKVNGLEIKLT